MSSLDLDSTYGALLLGAEMYQYLFQFCKSGSAAQDEIQPFRSLQGILSVQAYLYYETFPEDSRTLKGLVAIALVPISKAAVLKLTDVNRTLDFAHLIVICPSHVPLPRRQLGGNDAALLETTIPLGVHLVLLSLSGITCQAFFIHRIWRFSRNKGLTGVLAAACLATAILDIVMAGQTIHNKIAGLTSRTCTAEVIAVFAVGAGVDLSIAVILCCYLHREMSIFDRINSLLTRIIQYTLATGLATSLLALGCLIAYLVSPHTFIFLAMHFSLGRMYTNALLATLNSRKRLRALLAPPGLSKWSGVLPTQTEAVFEISSETGTPHPSECQETASMKTKSPNKDHSRETDTFSLILP
ncbi:hypothetical protein B0H14DRAFT_3145530 [Mycena olivaceomarginata]|nr:hypothetical protein B0H14DRAFT_3145530 [Mycena olivaceomarginata]